MVDPLRVPAIGPDSMPSHHLASTPQSGHAGTVGFIGIIARRGYHTITKGDVCHMYIAVIPGANRQYRSNVSIMLHVSRYGLYRR